MARYGHDILHCPNYECERSQRCYRHQAYNEAREMSLTITVQLDSKRHCIDKGYRLFSEDDTELEQLPSDLMKDKIRQAIQRIQVASDSLLLEAMSRLKIYKNKTFKISKES